MSKRLTEDMVISRTKISDLSKVKRLNCWGSELEDVSLLRRMPFVEVLSLSINKIHSLEEFQYCKRLEELYIRQNDIRDVNEVMYLQNLPNLKNLWLDENPCALVDGYRLAVIKALPQLHKLDNVTITREELQDAQRKGKNLYLPNETKNESEEEYAETSQPQFQTFQNYSPEYSPPQVQSPLRQEMTEYDIEESEELYQREDASEDSRGDYSPPRQPTPPRREQMRRSYSPEPEYIERRNSYERESPRQLYERESPRQRYERDSSGQYYERKSSPTNNNTFEGKPNDATAYRDTNIINSQSANCIKECTNGERYTSSNSGNEVTSPQVHDKKERYNCPAAAHRPPFNRRPVTRNSNILSAVLCLVKELDYPSLEVVEMAVRCRMDELDE